ncbi:MAG: PilZ domain-containing protein [Gammaproteobacteria bacterium]|nr:PilZ domain-containing protein [Gammaproteobacteria bacterium]
MVDSSDMRDFRRISIDCGVTLKNLDSGSVYSGVATNLSATGVLIECKDQLAVGDQLEINIVPEKTIVPPLHALVEIIRIGQGGEGKVYQVACAISEMKS